MYYFYLSIIIINFFLNLCESKETNSSNFILIPFSIEDKYQSIHEYNSEIFIKNHFIKNLILNFNLGNPFQKINGIIEKNNLCFELKDGNNSSISFQEKYIPKQSSSFSLTSKPIYRTYKKDFMIIGYDFISFGNKNKYNMSFLLQITEEENITIEYFKNKGYFAKIGINKPIYYSRDDCPNFISEIKQKANLSNYILSFEFINSNKGNIIIGDELYRYNNKKYHKSQYVHTHSNDDFEIFFDDIIVSDNHKNKNISFNGTYGFFDFNLGVIIGSKEYKQIINDLFFNKLIMENICQIDNITYNDSHIYSVYSCNDDIEKLKNFPKLTFASKNYLYNFEFIYSDLFIKLANNKYYFLIMFRANNMKKTKDTWILGQPFYTKYTFTLNLDEKIIFFYNENLPIDKEDLPSPNKKRNFAKIIVIISLIIFILGLLVLAFYLGMVKNRQRKQRANELKDDNFEYFSESKENNKGLGL